MRNRIVIDVDEQARTVLSIWEHPNNYDLNLHITSGGKTYQADSFSELVAGTEESNYQRSEKHISVHNSPNSAENNVIKRTIGFVGGGEETAVQVTSGIKRDNLFVPALFRVCGNLTRDRYLLPAECTDNLISLGQMNPSNDQLRFMVVISRSGTGFPSHKEHPSNSLEIPFTNFTVTLIWSYLNQPSHPHAIDFFLRTTRAEGPIRGFEWHEIYDMYTDLYMAHANQYFEVYQ